MKSTGDVSLNTYIIDKFWQRFKITSQEYVLLTELVLYFVRLSSFIKIGSEEQEKGREAIKGKDRTD